MLTPREISPLYRKMSPEEDRTRDAVDSEPKHYQLSYSGPHMVQDMPHVMSAQCVAHDLCMVVPWPLEHTCWRVTTSSLTMEVEAVTHAIQWLASQRDARITHAIILTDSMNLLQKVESGMGCPDWHTAMHSLRLQRLLWIYCPGHAGVSGNERADRLASTADITSGLQLGRAEVLRGLRNFLSTDKPEHHSIDRLKERGVEKGSG